MNNEKEVRREKKEEKRERRKGEEGRRFCEGIGGDANGHEVSLVTTAAEKMRAHL